MNQPRKNPFIDIGIVGGGKVPPQAKETEQAFLGTLLMWPDYIPEIADKIEPCELYDANYGVVLEAILSLYKDGRPVDNISLCNLLEANGKLEQCGGRYGVIELSQYSQTPRSLQEQILTIKEKYILREVIRISMQSSTKAYDTGADPFEVLGFLSNELISIQNSISKLKEINWGTIVDETIGQIEEAVKEPKDILGQPTYLKALDGHTHGMQDGDLIVIAARPSAGKTTFTLDLVRKVAKFSKKKIGFIQLEMMAGQLAIKLLSAESNINSNDLRTGRFDPAQMNNVRNAGKVLKEFGLLVDDKGGQAVEQICMKARSWALKHDIKLLVIDYLQLINMGKGNRDQAIGNVTRSLKQLAKDLMIPVILLSQLNRDSVSGGTVRRPNLSDLRESGNIEQDADMVWFLFRPEHHGILEMEDGTSSKGVTEIIIGKNRMGELATVMCSFVPQTSSFKDYDPNQQAIQALEQDQVDKGYTRLRPNSKLQELSDEEALF